jgi:hypothetical protein
MAPRNRPSKSANNDKESIWAVRLLRTVIAFAAFPLILGVGYLIRYVTPGHKAAAHWDLWLMSNMFSHGALFWFWLAACLLVTGIMISVTGSSMKRRHASTAILTIVAVAASIIAFANYGRVLHDNSATPGAYYNSATVLYVPDLDASDEPSLSRLFPELHESDGKRCNLIGADSLPACVKVGTLPSAGWDSRTSSLSGATYALSRSTGYMQNVSLDQGTVTYLNTWHGQPAGWSGILNGSGNGTGLGGVAIWNGSKATACNFAGKYAIDRSFGASGDADLNDLLNETYPGLFWNISDVWGYCDGSQPIVVIPMIRQIYFGDRTLQTAAGIVKVQGNNGQAVLTYQPNVPAGQYPGPVFPRSLVDSQVNQVSWMAGRRPHDSYNFGYEPANSSVQAGNVSDYLLRDSATGRLEWVTPLTLNGSSSQLFVAYAVSYADTVANGQLNQLSLYVLGNGDPRQVNIDNMEAQARAWFAQQVPGFISSGGKLLEFTPLGGNLWRAYGEINGRVDYLLDFDATGIVSPALTDVSGISKGSPSGGAKLNCDNPSQLTEAQIATCIEQLSQYLAQHAGGSTSR